MRMCYHCGAPDALRLGTCRVCDEAVCERCGNTDHVKGEITAIHEKCRAKDGDGGFTMIKFVK
jgi:hypothetical protein